MLFNRLIFIFKMLGYAWCTIALLITWISDWALVSDKNTIFGITVFNVKDSYALAWLLFPGTVILLFTYVLGKRFGIGLSKKAALKQYLKLGALLAKRYGLSKQYSPAQVKQTIDDYRLNSSYIAYAYAAFLSFDDYQNICQDIEVNKSYHDLRGEIASKYKYFYNSIGFNGNSMNDANTKDGADHDSGDCGDG